MRITRISTLALYARAFSHVASTQFMKRIMTSGTSISIASALRLFQPDSEERDSIASLKSAFAKRGLNTTAVITIAKTLEGPALLAELADFRAHKEYPRGKAIVKANIIPSVQTAMDSREPGERLAVRLT